jgi:S-adenosylmethionine hydrolase
MLSDYGRRDGFVSSCQGVVAQIAPTVRVVDITHDVPPFDVRHGAAVLAQTVRYLPPSLIVGVVDPGVGTGRRGIAVAAGHSLLVGPDNGLLLWAADALGGARTAVELTEPAFRVTTLGRTFDGRDVFAPAAAHLANGVALGALGSSLDVGDLVRLTTPRVEVRPGVLVADVLTVDHFGNIQLAATAADLDAAGLAHLRVEVGIGDRSYDVALGSAFADVAAGDLVLYIDSAGHAALALNRGSAAYELRVEPGEVVTVTG